MFGGLTDRYTNTHEFSFLQRRSHRIHGVAEGDSNGHCDEDPYYQEAVEER
jgi:hypothetical protein